MPYCLKAVLALICTLFLVVPLCLGEEAGDVGRIRGENGELSVVIAVPLTTDHGPIPDTGWGQMAAALVAVDHFNDKNPVVVHQLQEPQFADCPIRIIPSVIDAGSNSHNAMKSLLHRIQQVGVVDGIAGPYDAVPAMELSVLATGMEAPMVAFRGLDQNLILPDKHPFYSQINPDLYGEMEFIANYLHHTNRTDFLCILYGDDDSVLQRVEVLQIVLKEKLGCENVKAYSYLSVGKVQAGDDRGIRDAVSRVAQTGFRTILLLTTTPDIDTPLLGAAARDYQLDQGGHFWVLLGGLDPTGTGRDRILYDYKNRSEGGFLRGAAYSYLFDYTNLFQTFHDLESDSALFALAMGSQNASFVQRLIDINPIVDYKAKFFCEHLNETEWSNPLYNPECEPRLDMFEKLYVTGRMGFAYDATMAIGIGACLAIANKTNATAMTGQQHLEGIQSVDFRGVSGKVRFRNRPGTPGSRDGSSTYFGILNLLPLGKDGPEILISEYLDPDSNDWIEINQFVFSDGSNSPPKLLRSVPEQNFLDPIVRGFGLGLMTLALLSIFVSAVWVMIHRKHRVVIAAQPPFLYVLCLGSTLSSLVILVCSFDESHGWDDAMLDKACVAIPWLFILGDMIVYSALFTKLWRVNKVLQFKRARIKVRQVVWPALLLMMVTIVLLSIWTAISDFGWVREEIDALSGESIGHCTGCYVYAFLVPVCILCIIPTLLTCVMAWKTCDVDDMYSESKWIFTLVLVQLQVMVVGVPVVAILQTVSTNGRYIGLSLIVATFPISTMGLIFVPKMLVVRKERIGGPKSSTRGSSQGVVVSGLNIPEGELQARSSGNNPRNPSEPLAGSRTTAPFYLSSSRIQTVTIE